MQWLSKLCGRCMNRKERTDINNRSPKFHVCRLDLRDDECMDIGNDWVVKMAYLTIGEDDLTTFPIKNLRVDGGKWSGPRDS